MGSPGTSLSFTIAIKAPVRLSQSPLFPQLSADASLRSLDLGKVLIGIQSPPEDNEAFEKFLDDLAYPYKEMTDNAVYRRYLRE